MIYFDVLVNGHKIRAFLDTGSTINVISKSQALNLNLNINTRTSLLVGHIGGSTRSAGRTTFNLTIGRITQSITVYIFNNFDLPLLISGETASLFNIAIDLKSHKLVEYDAQPAVVNTLKAITYEDINGLKINNRIFAKDKNDIGRITIGTHIIRLKNDCPPIYRGPYPQSAATNDLIRKLVDEMQTSGIIRPSTSPWAFPVTIVRKKDGNPRFCVDYRKLNTNTIDEHTPIPNVEDLLHRVANKRIYTLLDLAWGYWQVPMDPHSIEKTAFVTSDAQYEFTVMPFGLKNAPSTFQRIVRQLIRPFIDKGVENYLDDIIVFSDTVDEHRKTLEQVINALISVNLKLRREKCKFFTDQIEVLGHIVSHRQIRTNHELIRSVVDFPNPRNIKEVQRFNGLANYYRNFIRDFSSLSAPLYGLTRKNVPFIWTEEHETAFTELKTRLSSAPVLTAFDPKRKIRLLTDASIIGIGAILSQIDENGNERVIGYFSKKISNTESRYTAYELECYAIVKAVKRFHVFIDGQHFDVYTDCRATNWLKNFKDTKTRLYRWSLTLSTYDYETHYRPGITNQAADALSRAPVLVITNYETHINEITEYNIKLPTYERDGQILVKLPHGERIIIPPSLRKVILESLHEQSGHPGIRRTKLLFSTQYWFPNWTDYIKQYVQSCHSCQITNPSNTRTLGQLQPIETPDRPNDTWAMDTIVIGSDSRNTSAKYVQLIVDHHSRYTWAKATKRNTAEAVVDALQKAIENAGSAPNKLIVDNATNFKSKTFRKFVKTHNINIAYVSAYHPQANGLCERTNGSIVKHITLRLIDKPNIRWSSALEPALKDYNKLPHTATGYSPESLHFGRNLPQSKTLQLIREEATLRSRNTQSNRKSVYDKLHVSSDFKEQDLVLVRIPETHPTATKFSPRYDGPYFIITKIGPETYRLRRSCLKIAHQNAVFPSEITAHSSRLKTYYDRSVVNLLTPFRGGRVNRP